MKSVRDYKESLEKLSRKVYAMGKLVDNTVEHPLVQPSWRSVALSYDLAEHEEHEDLMTAYSPLTGGTINRFTHIQQDREDLTRKIKMLRLMGQRTGSCFQRCAGLDCINTLYSVTHDIDNAHGTSYHRRFLDFLFRVQSEDLVCDAAMTDPKGNRRLPPYQQHDPDLYLRVVDRNNEGIIVRGAKAHQTGALNSHYIVALPTTMMGEKDRDYVVSFAVPADAPGVSFVYGRQPSDTRRLEEGGKDAGNLYFGGHEALIIFEDVFVPHELIFMDGEYEFTPVLVERFASYHRASYGGCKVGVGDVLIGATGCMARYHGIEKSSHVRDKLVEMNYLNETLYSCGLASSCAGTQLASGNYFVDPLLANVCKLNVTRLPFEIARLAQDICGGIMVTLPSDQDFQHPQISELLKKYYQGIEEIDTATKVQMIRLVENLTLGSGASAYLTESVHGAGSPQAQRIMIERNMNLEHKMELARSLLQAPPF